MPKSLRLVVAACCLLFTSTALAQTAWTTIQDGDQTFLARLDLATAEAEAIAAMPFGPTEALAPGPGRDLFAVSRLPWPTLYRIDTSTFDVVEVGPLGFALGTSYRAMTAGENGELYLIVEEFERPPGLYHVDRETGQASLIGYTDRSVLALVADSGRLIGLSFESEGPGLYEIDTTTAVMTLLLRLPELNLGFITALDRRAPGHLLLLNHDVPLIAPPHCEHRIFSIDLDAGSADLLAHSTGPLNPYRGLVIAGDGDIVAVPGLGASGLPIFVTLLVMAGLAAIRHNL